MLRLTLLFSVIVLAGLATTLAQGQEGENSPSLIYRPRMDLHTHLSGILSAEIMLQIAEDGRLLYPEGFLEHMGYRPDTLEPFVREDTRSGRLVVELFQFFNARPDLRKRFLDHISTDPFHISFTSLDAVYIFRSPIASAESLCEPILTAVGETYRSRDVRYVEISSRHILQNPEWMDVAAPVIERIEKETGVALRFLVGIDRHVRANSFERVLQQVAKVFVKPFVLGYDILGKEDHLLEDIAPLVVALNKLLQDIRMNDPKQSRIHIGESLYFTGEVAERNLRLALTLGATRGGHVIRGWNDENFRMALDQGFISEGNYSSNELLDNLAHPGLHPASRIIESGNFYTSGTDGMDIFHTSPTREFVLTLQTGIDGKELARAQQRTESFHLRNVNCAHLLAN